MTTFAQLAARGSLLLNDGYRTKVSELGPEGFPILRVAEIADGYVTPTFADFIRPEFEKSIGVKLSQPGDVLLTTKGTVGRRAIMSDLGQQFAYSPQLCFFRVMDSSIDPRWLYYWLAGSDFWLQAAGVAQQTDMAPYISLRDLRAISIEVPPVYQQRAIAATLGALDDKIESNRRAVALIEELVKAIFAEAFDVAHKHEGVPISDLVGVNSKRQLSRGTEATYIGMAALPENSMSIAEWETRPFGSGTKFINGDVLMARITPCLENGKTAVIDMLQPDEVAWGSTEFVVLSPRGEISTPWIYSLVRSEPVRSFAIGRMSGTSGRQRFNATEFSKYQVTPPSADQLAEFNEFAVPAFSKAGQLRDESTRLANLRDALLPELLSGRIKVSEARETIEETIDEEVPHA